MTGRDDAGGALQRSFERIVLTMTMQQPSVNGNLNWITSLLNLAEHAAEDGEIEAVRTAKELAARLRSVENIYESDETAGEVTNSLVALQRAINPEFQEEPLTADPQMLGDFVELTNATLTRVGGLLDQEPTEAEAAEILRAFRKVEDLASFLQLSQIANLSRSVAATVGQAPRQRSLGLVRQTSQEILNALTEIHPLKKDQA